MMTESQVREDFSGFEGYLCMEVEGKRGKDCPLGQGDSWKVAEDGKHQLALGRAVPSKKPESIRALRRKPC